MKARRTSKELHPFIVLFIDPNKRLKCPYDLIHRKQQSKVAGSDAACHIVPFIFNLIST
jgi:hypothetical protein